MQSVIREDKRRKLDRPITGVIWKDRIWEQWYDKKALELTLPKMNQKDYLFKCLGIDSSRVIINNRGKKKYTVKQFHDMVDTYTKSFAELNYSVGDVVCTISLTTPEMYARVIMFTNSSPELIYSLFAICRIGAVANMINPIFTHEQIIDRINETDAEIMFVLDQLFEKIQPIIPQLCVKKIIIISAFNEMPAVTKAVASLKTKSHITYSEKIVRWNAFISDGSNDDKTPDVIYEKGLPLVMVYSSGTTGASKGIVLTNNGINATVSHYFSTSFSCKRENRFLQSVPCWFSTGLVFSILMPVCLGITIVLDPIFSQKAFAIALRKYTPNIVIGPWNYAVKNSELKNVDLSFVSMPITGGEFLSFRSEIEINSFLQNAGCNEKLLKGYGMCELGSTVTSDTPLHSKVGSVGFPIRGVTVSVFDSVTNKEMKYGERGEIRVDSPARMKEYYKNLQATKDFFYTDENGVMWGRTGDIGYVDEDGFLFVLGRASDTFTSKSGEKTYCFDIEAAIRENENVADCEVVGISANGYEIPVAHIIVKEGCESYEDKVIETIHMYCQQNLPENAVPCGYKICKPCGVFHK